MNRTDLFDKILQNRFENPNGFLSMLTLSEREFGITDENMIKSIVDEMIESNWVEPTNHSIFDVMIKYDGQQLIEKYGTYSSFLRDLKKSKSKEQVLKRIDRALNNISKISAIFFGLTSYILGYNKFFVDDVKIDNQQTELKALEKTIDSLKTKLRKQHTIE